MNIHSPVSSLNRVGKALEKRLLYLGIETVEDLLMHFPFRYEDYSEVTPIGSLKSDTQTTVVGTIELIANKRSPRKRTIITNAVVADATGQVRVVWFGQPFISKTLHAGDEVYLSGKVTNDVFGTQMIGPVYEKKKEKTTNTARIVPIYPLTNGITEKQMRFLMEQVIHLATDFSDWLADDIREQADVISFAEAIRCIHFPDSQDEYSHALERLKFDELFILQLRAEMIRQSLTENKAPKMTFHKSDVQEFVASFPFILTKDQKIAAWEIIQDMEKEVPMNRLLEGDVGSGKTVVAAMALYTAMLDGYQGVLMAPTEILARQHFASLTKLFEKQDVQIGLLTRADVRANKEIIRNKKQSFISKKRELKKSVESGKTVLLVATHAVLTKDVRFKNLGLVIIDEQHRFGVEQRKMIREKSGCVRTYPHFLSMTATPIPRSFALALYGDLDLSFIRQMPAGRKPIQTRLVEPHNRDKAYQFIRDQVQQKRQVFVVCPLIDSTTSVSSKKSVLDEYEKLSTDIFSDLHVGFIHGKLKADEKAETMEQFETGKIDILVSTSVVEVGVNIPNASVMMIECAEQFGLAQLHQFRGRVGRSNYQSYCFIFTDSDSKQVVERLKFFESTVDGFKVAKYDLDRRGPGEVYGKAQSGMAKLKLATLNDGRIIKKAHDLARGINFLTHPTLREKVAEWERTVHLE